MGVPGGGYHTHMHVLGSGVHGPEPNDFTGFVFVFARKTAFSTTPNGQNKNEGDLVGTPKVTEAPRPVPRQTINRDAGCNHSWHVLFYALPCASHEKTISTSAISRAQLRPVPMKALYCNGLSWKTNTNQGKPVKTKDGQ